MMTSRASPGIDPQWDSDCELICHYLIDRKPTGELIGRYREAMRVKFSDRALSDVEWCWLRRHPRALPFLDAAAGLLQPSSPLRQRVYLMMAILEAAPALSDRFLPRARSTPVLLVEVGWNVARAATKAIVGVPMLLWARRAR